jgi:hypothetical protein
MAAQGAGDPNIVCGDGNDGGGAFINTDKISPNSMNNIIEDLPTCIIHLTNEDPQSNLTTPKDHASWSTLFKAAQLKNYAPILNIAANIPSGEVPLIHYHRQCRCRFTLKRDLDAILSRNNNDYCTQKLDQEQGKSKRPSRHTSSSNSRVMDKICIFCDKQKYKKGTHTRETLVQCTDLRADKSLRDIAIQKQDDKLMAILSRDIVAAEAHYHRSCYKDYCRRVVHNLMSCQDSDTHPTTSDTADFDLPSYNTFEKQAYGQMFDFIRYELFTEPKVIPMTCLSKKVTDCMKSLGVTELKDSTIKHIRRNLECEFQDVLHIFPDDAGKLLVMPDNMSRYKLAKENATLTRQLEQLQRDTQGDYSTIDKAAASLRSVIRNSKVEQEFPRMPSSLDTASICIPSVVTRFLICLLTGSPEPKNMTERVQWLVASFAQDMIYAVSCGKQKPPKHILLAAAVKALTGNVELMQALNRLGHAVSYWQVEENETALCMKKLATTAEGHVVLPENIFPSLFTTLAWDNIDILEETLTGGGTSHRVNGIIIQPTAYGPQQKQHLMQFTGKHKRSVCIDDLNLPIYISGQRVGPGTVMTNHQYHRDTDRDVFIKNLIWILLRQVQQINQGISSWTGFHITIRKGIEVKNDTIGYLSTINAPATEMATVSEILNRSKNIMNDLHLQNVVLVFDQALYAKVAEVLWKHKESYKGIIIRMGTFHTMCNLLSILGKRFQDAGLRDLCIESGVLAEGSVSAVMEGRQYNRAVRIHKYVYEALMRLAWRGFACWLEQVHPEKKNHLEQMQELASDLHENVNKGTYDEILGHPIVHSTASLFQEYLNHIRHDNGALSSYWMSYVDMVGDLLLGLLRSSREGDWALHMSTIHAMIPWCFAYDKVNYAR